jgi:hypothetical protein
VAAIDPTQAGQAGHVAETLADQVRRGDGDLAPVYGALEAATLAYREAGGSLQSVIPGSAEAALGFTRGRPDGKAIWTVYAEVLYEELCDPEGELHQKVTIAVATSGAALVTLILGALGLPAVAAPIVAPVAGSILGLGVKTFCRYVAETTTGEA